MSEVGAPPIRTATNPPPRRRFQPPSTLVSFAADDGRVLRRYDRISNGIANSCTPIVLGDGLLCANGYGRGGIARLNLTRRDNEVVAKEAYFQAEVLDPFEDSTVVVDGRLYAFNFGGLLQCFDMAEGKRLWGPIRGPRGKAAATYADGHLYIRNADGDVRLVETNPAEYVAKGHFQLDEPRKGVGATFPVVAGGRLYIRDNDRLYCYDVNDHGANAVAPKTNVVALEEPREAPNADQKTLDGPKAIFVPTPHDVVERMVKEAGAKQDDVVYDLGSGDGRIVVAAASKYGCRAIGLEIDRDLVSLSREEVSKAKMEKLATIREADILTAEFKDATVVAVYLYPCLLQRLLPKFDQLKPGSRIVSHQFAFPDVPPHKEVAIESIVASRAAIAGDAGGNGIRGSMLFTYRARVRDVPRVVQVDRRCGWPPTRLERRRTRRRARRHTARARPKELGSGTLAAWAIGATSVSRSVASAANEKSSGSRQGEPSASTIASSAGDRSASRIESPI
jgi:hypothetical protein